MSFFIRKKGGRSLGDGATGKHGEKRKLGNTDMKIRKTKKTDDVNGTNTRKDGRHSRKRGLDNRKGRGTDKRAELNGTGNTNKKPRFDPNEEIESSSDDDDGKKNKDSEGRIFEEYGLDALDDPETAADKKVRLAKLYLEEIEREEKERAENDDVDEGLHVSNRLKEDILEAEGRLRREVADKVTVDESAERGLLTCSKYLKKSVTCLCISSDDQYVFSGCKDGHLIKWSVKEGKKVAIVKRKEKISKRKAKKGVVPKTEGVNPNSIHSSSINAIAISSDGKFLATGDQDKQVVIWNPDTLTRVHIFTGHRGAIRGLVFRKKTHTLYSSSDDRSVRIWSLDEMGYVETLFGHQDAVSSVDALTRERAISAGGRDNSIRVWKIVEESQLVYNGHYNGSIDVVKLVNEENFISGGDDGLISTWNVNRKKPLFSVRNAHGTEATPDGTGENPRWVSALAAWNNTDLIASGSCDGYIRLWKCGERFKNLTEVCKIPCPGWINSIQFSHGPGMQIKGKFLIVGVGKEHKLGRWFDTIKEARNSIVIIPLCSKIVNQGSEVPASADRQEVDEEDIVA